MKTFWMYFEERERPEESFSRRSASFRILERKGMLESSRMETSKMCLYWVKDVFWGCLGWLNSGL